MCFLLSQEVRALSTVVLSLSLQHCWNVEEGKLRWWTIYRVSSFCTSLDEAFLFNTTARIRYCIHQELRLSFFLFFYTFLAIIDEYGPWNTACHLILAPLLLSQWHLLPTGRRGKILIWQMITIRYCTEDHWQRILHFMQ